jgi:hypothetical protein
VHLGGLSATTARWQPRRDSVRSTKEEGMPRELNPKVIGPWRAAAYNALTLGLYSLRWYYRVNRELRDFGAARGDAVLAATRPGRSLVAVTLGRWLIVPPMLGYVGFGRRLQRSERLAAIRAHSAGGIVALLILTASVGILPLTGDARLAQLVAVLTLQSAAVALGQARLNALWRATGVAAAAREGAGAVVTRAG